MNSIYYIGRYLLFTFSTDSGYKTLNSYQRFLFNFYICVSLVSQSTCFFFCICSLDNVNQLMQAVFTFSKSSRYGIRRQ
jgi:hypothetical protein